MAIPEKEFLTFFPNSNFRPTIPSPNHSFANPPQHPIHIFDKNMPSQTDSSVVADTRTLQQKAAATRKANKAAEEKKSQERQDSAGE